MARVELRELTKKFAAGRRSVDGKSVASHSAVDNVSLTISDREFFVLLGPSGCGKSTTLRMIAGLDEPTSGEVCIGDRVVNDVAPKDRDIAMVFQNYALYPHMNVYQNMAFGLELRFKTSRLRQLFSQVWPAAARTHRQRRAEIDRRVHAAADMLGIRPLLHRLPRQLSGGERQRVALGRAIVREPAAFLFDEPLSNLDAKLRGEMRREIKRLHRSLSATMIYVTHDQIEAMTLADRMAVMNRGTVQQVGPPEDVYRRPANRFVAQFLGTPPMNVIRGVASSTSGPNAGTFVAESGWNIQLPKDWRTLHHPQAARDRTDQVWDLGFRPEAISLEGISLGGPKHQETGDFARFDAQVSLVEPLGDSELVHLEPCVPAATGNSDGSPQSSDALDNKPQVDSEPEQEVAKTHLVCKCPATTKPRPGDTITGYVRLEEIHVFDPNSGRRFDPADA